MEFLSPKQKRDKSRQLFLGYGLFGILIVLATYIMVSTALGYEIFSTKGEIVHNGLLFIDSRPDNATITINGVKESSDTNAKLSLPEGKYEIKLQKDGFYDWSRTINLFGGSVEFLTYPRLLPTSPNELSVTSYAGTSTSLLQSRDKRWLVLHSQSDPLVLHLHDLNSPLNEIASLNLPVLSTNSPQFVSVDLLEWAGDNVHFIAQINYANSTNQLVIFDREKPGEIVDITAMFGLSGTFQANFWDAKWDEIILLDSSGTVRLGSVKDRALNASALIAEKVQQLFLLNDKKAIYTVNNSEGSTAVRMLNEDKTYQIISYLMTDKKLVVKGAKFNRNDYLIIAGGGLEKALLYRNIQNSNKQSTTGKISPFVTIPINAESVDFSRSARFVLASSKDDVLVYDIEQKELSRFKHPTLNTIEIGWFDDSRLYSRTKDGALSIFDFNGINIYELSKNVVAAPYVNQPTEAVGLLLDTNGSRTLRVVDIISKPKQATQ